jgi:hypothetical protein
MYTTFINNYLHSYYAIIHILYIIPSSLFYTLISFLFLLNLPSKIKLIVTYYNMIFFGFFALFDPTNVIMYKGISYDTARNVIIAHTSLL